MSIPAVLHCNIFSKPLTTRLFSNNSAHRFQKWCQNLTKNLYLYLLNIYINLNEADDNNIEEPCRAICTGALIFSSQFNIPDINSTQEGLVMLIIWKLSSYIIKYHMISFVESFLCLILNIHSYKLNVVQAPKLIFKFSVSPPFFGLYQFALDVFSSSIFMINFKIPFGLSEFHQFNAPTQLNDQTFKPFHFSFDNKVKWNKGSKN